MIKIIITDDHQMVIDGLKSILDNSEGVKVIATANNGRELLRLLEILDTDVVLMDIDMPVMNGIETMQAIKNSNKSCKVIILTMHEERALVKKMTDSGAKGYLFKNSDKEELLLAIKRVHEGGVYFSSALTLNLLGAEKMEKGSTSEGNVAYMLTDREIEILKLIASGLSNKEIGDQLFISHRTVDTHRTNLMKKLEINNIAGLIRFAIKNGYIQ
ncbi:MAG: response regulator transcription factor [Bacteroidales bacterium]|nr:response regulator transcription factor [Bacteroidales bacterium]